MIKIQILTYLALILVFFSYSQNKGRLTELEEEKNKLKFEITKLNDSLRKINVQIALLKTKRDSLKKNSFTFKAFAINGAKLRNGPNVNAEILRIFKEDIEIVIFGYNYEEEYFKVCIDSLCGYMSELWVKKNAQIYNLINSRGSNQKYFKQSNFKNRKKQLRTYHKGPRGGCYYINSNGNKTYVSRSLCN